MSTELILAIVGIIGTLVGSFGSAALANHFATQREERQWKRQFAEQRRQERLDACEDFAALALRVSLGEVHDNTEISRILTRVELRNTPEVAAAALQLLDASEIAEAAAAGEDDDKRKAANTEFAKKRTAFLRMAHEENSPEAFLAQRDSANHS